MIKLKFAEPRKASIQSAKTGSTPRSAVPFEKKRWEFFRICEDGCRIEEYRLFCDHKSRGKLWGFNPHTNQTVRL